MKVVDKNVTIDDEYYSDLYNEYIDFLTAFNDWPGSTTDKFLFFILRQLENESDS